jgi:type II secretory pathway pseudopilin PulG
MNTMHSFSGPRAVPARSAQEQTSVIENPEGPGAIVAAASRDGSRSDRKPDAAPRSHAFTLIELLVVVGLIVMWVAMLAPGLAHTRPNVRLIQCLSNKHQLAVACSMYSHDWIDYLVPNAPVVAYYGWCNGNGTESWTAALGNTNLNLYTTNCLAAYVGNRCKAYKCPDDTIPSANGDRIRSISMNGQMLGATPAPGYYNSGWRSYKKVSDLTTLTPAMAWVFCDESMFSLNDGYMQMSLGNPSYPDVPAAYHGGANCFSFADGHAEAHKWEYKGTSGSGLMNCPYRYGSTGTYWGSSALDMDWQWLKARTSSPL